MADPVSHRIDFCSLDDVKQHKRITRWVEELRDEVTALKVPSGLLVISSVCLHMGGEMNVDWEKQQFCCRWHDWRFDLQTGECVTFSLPGRRLRHYRWEVEDGHIIIIS